jgi:hypothetical protein
MTIDKNKLLIMSVLLLALAESGIAADITGKWIVPNDDARIELVFTKVDGTTCTGTSFNSKLGEIELKDCKIEGDTISFNVMRKIAVNEYKNVWSGKISGDKIEFTNTTQQIRRTTAVRVGYRESSKTSISGVDISGKWMARLQSGEKVELVFIPEGAKFTGVLVIPNEAQKEIANGKIEGDTISFNAVDDESKVRWEGTVAGDEIRFMTATTEGSRQLTANKASSNPPPKVAAAPLDLSGKWVGRVPGGGPRFELYFAVKGNTFTGTVINAELGEAVMNEGKIEGDAISFYVPRNDTKAQWKGRIVGDELRATLTGRDGSPVSITFARVSSDPGARAVFVDLSGTWSAITPDGAKIEMYFITKGAGFTGVLVYSKGGEIAMKGGAIDGNVLSFYVNPKQAENPESKISWKGKVVGDEIEFAYTASGSDPQRITFTRARPKPQSTIELIIRQKTGI